MKKIIDKRRGLRFPQKRPIAIITEDKVAYKGTITDRSTWGAFVSTKKSFSVGQNIFIAFLSDDNKIKEKKKALVMRVTDKGIGVKYAKADFSLIPPPGF
jgi:Tfp pilus assembly protein PilZ